MLTRQDSRAAELADAILAGNLHVEERPKGGFKVRFEEGGLESTTHSKGVHPCAQTFGHCVCWRGGGGDARPGSC